MRGAGLFKDGLVAADPPVTWEQTQSWPTNKVCVRGSLYPALDIDSEHQIINHAVMDAVEQWLGGGALQRRGRKNSSRLLTPFQAAEPGSVKSWRISFRVPGHTSPDGKDYLVELIAAGKQWVGSGTHTSGADYEWIQGTWPVEVPDADMSMPVLRDQAHADELREVVLAVLKKHGCEIIAAPEGPKGGTSLDHVDTRDLDPIVPLETLEKALEATTPFGPDHQAHHDDGVALVAAMRYMLGRDGEVMPDFVRNWFAEGWGGAEVAERIWESCDWVEPSPARFMRHLAENCTDPERVAFKVVQRARNDREGIDLFAAPVDEEMLQIGEPSPERPARGGDDRPGDPEEVLRNLTRSVIHLDFKDGWVDRSVTREDMVVKDLLSFNNSDIARRISEADWRAREGRGRARKASEVLLARPDLTRVQAMTYDPTMPTPIFERDGILVLNTYVPHRIERRHVEDAEVAIFLAFLRLTVPNEREQVIILDWLSFIAQNVGKKVQWAPVFFSETHGTGKDSLLRVLRSIVGRHNFKEIDGRAVEELFNDDWTASRVTYLNELESHHRRNVYDSLKRWVSSTGSDDIRVNKKFQSSYRVPNRHCWVITTNKADALALDVQDRRFVIIQFREQKLTKEERTPFHEFMDNGGGDVVASWLLQRKISDAFDAFDCPAGGDAKKAMIWRAVPPDVESFMDLITEGAWSERTVVSLPEARSYAGQNARLKNVDFALRQAGFVTVSSDGRGRINTGGHGSPKVKVYVRVGSEAHAQSISRGRQQGWQSILMRRLLDEQKSTGSHEAEATEEMMRPKAV
jgi:hypothetical protein